MKREILFEKFSKENEIERQKANHDNCSKTRRRNERKRQTRHQKSRKSREKYDTQKNRKNRQNIKESRKNRKKDNIIWFWNREFHEIKNRISLFFLTKKRKNTNIDTNIETLKQLTMIVTILTKSYFSTNDIAEFIDELNKRKRRILTQISEIFTKLSKRWKVLFFEKDFHFYDKKDNDSNDNNDLDFFFHKLNENLWKKRKKSKKISIFIEILKRTAKRFRFFSFMMKRKEE